MATIKASVILPDKRKGEVEIDAAASIGEVKRAIVNDLNLGKPENFILAVSVDEEISIGNIKLKDGSRIFILESQLARGAVVKFVDPQGFN
jgi:hypothetical protein